MRTMKPSIEKHTGIFLWSLLWAVPLLAGLLTSLTNDFHGIQPFSFKAYQSIRIVGAVVVLCLMTKAFLRAFCHVANRSAWSADSFLIWSVLFWALFPPSWFFVEYTMFDLGQIALPLNKGTCGGLSEVGKETYCQAFLDRLQAYATLASKIWAAVGAMLAAVVAIAKSEDA
jgi:hypothetical protein